MGGAGLLAMLLLAGAVIFFRLVGGSYGATTVPTSTRPNDQRARQAVEAFMGAYVAGRGDQLRATMQSSEDLSLVNDRALQESVKRAPIEGVEISRVEAGSSTFVKFTVGGEAAHLTIIPLVPEDPKAEAKIKVRSEPTSLESFAGVSITINGVRPATSRPILLPGSYTLGVENPNFEVQSAEATYTGYSLSSTWKLKLSATGEAAFRAKVKEAVTACVTEKTLQWSCGEDVVSDDTVTVHEGTVQRTIDASELAKIDTMTVETHYRNPIMASGSGAAIRVKTVVGCTKNGKKSVCEYLLLGPQLHTPVIDMSKPELKVIWE